MNGDDPDGTTRRSVLVATGGAVVAGLSGCLGSEPVPTVGSAEAPTLTETETGPTGTTATGNREPAAVVEGFERDTLTAYTGDLGQFELVDDPVESGTRALSATVSEEPADGRAIVSTGGLPTYPSAGGRFRTHVHLGDGKNGQLPGVGYGVQWEATDADRYAVILDDGSGTLRLQRRREGAVAAESAAGIDFPDDRWLGVTVEWGENGGHAVAVADATGATLATTDFRDRTFAEGGILWRANAAYGRQEIYFDRLVVF